MFSESPQPVFSACMHRHIQVITKGKMCFSEGEVWDNLQEYVLCFDCMCILSEMEVRDTWAGRGTSSTIDIGEIT